MNLENYIDQYLDGLLSEEENDRFETKCLEDKAFFAKVRAQKAFRAKVENFLQMEGEAIASEAELAKQAEQSFGFMKILDNLNTYWKNLNIFWRYALVPAGAVAIFILVLLLKTNDPFSKNPEYEKLLGSMPLRGIALKIQSPELEAEFSGNVTFCWQTEVAGLFEIIILDNHGKEIDMISTRGQQLVLNHHLPEGLYYWKFLVDGDWVYTGKFLVKKE